MTQKLVNLVKEWKEILELFDDKYMFDNGRFYPYIFQKQGNITFIKV